MLLLLLSCNGGGDTKPTPPLTDSNDTGTDTGTNTLPECTPQTGTSGKIALSGLVLLPEGAVSGAVVYDPGTGLISCAGDCDTSSDTVVCTEGIISPGLVDPHNHLQYNTLPPWQVDPEFTDRYEWQSDGRYYDYREAYDAIKSDYVCEIMKWAEAREIVYGVTAAVGSSGDSCIDVLIRNLDEDEAAHGLSGYDLAYSSSNISSLDETDAQGIRDDLSIGNYDGMLYHVAEGRDGSVRSEIDHMQELGITGPGFVYVHASDASTAQLAAMGADGTGVIWSPRSNLALYAYTTPVPLMETFGVNWALGTDWTPSGSMSQLPELQCADQWLATQGSPVSRENLWNKATSDAARLVGLDGVLGTLAPGMAADISVFSWGADPWAALFSAGPEDVRLVIVDGQARYGQADWIDQLASEPSWCDTLDVCGDSKKICVKQADSGDTAQTLGDVESALTAAMASTTMGAGYEYAGELYPIFTCDPAPSCDISLPTSGDEDGDGISDTSDVCVGLYDPEQWDSDADGMGDLCDDCPLAVGECTSNADDTDGDGVLNADDNCPLLGNSDQADRDGDLVGDVCDACPDEAGANGACTVAVDRVTDEGRGDHVPEGTTVLLQGLVVTGVDSGSGYFAQDPNLSTYAGIYIYDQGATVVALGDVVSVTGVYSEFYGLAEIGAAVTTVTGSTTPLSPMVVAACDIGTAGSLNESYESMLVAVQDVSVTNINPDDPSDYQEYELNGCLRVDDALWAYTDQPALDTHYSEAIGLLYYSFDNFKLTPRAEDDLRP